MLMLPTPYEKALNKLLALSIRTHGYKAVKQAQDELELIGNSLFGKRK